MPMSEVRLDERGVHVGPRLVVSFHRTLRVPDDGGTYPLPPGLGPFPVMTWDDLVAEPPAGWRDTDFFIPLHQREALWIGFDGADWKPNAVQVALGGVDALTGQAFAPRLSASPQNYLVCPAQPWLDGINAGEGWVRQFVAVSLGRGLTVESQLVEGPEQGALGLVVYEPKPGRFPDEPPEEIEFEVAMHAPQQDVALGLGAGGRLAQRIHPDPHGVDVWDDTSATRIVVHLVDTRAFTTLTGRRPPPTPIDATTYAAYGLPWFALYDEALGDIEPAGPLAGVKSVDSAEGGGPADSGGKGRRVTPGPVIGIRPRSSRHSNH